jgi:ABC-type Fe3+-hydroxamate transport system substrate-binding protein
VRVVSLVPSVTETLAAWDKDPVACTRFCERPDLPHVGGTKDPDVARIVELEPDLVVMDAEENRREDYQALIGANAQVLDLRVRSLEDVAREVSRLATRIGVTWRSARLPEPIAQHARAFVPIWRRPWMALGAPTYGTSLLAHLGIANVFADRGPYPEVDLDEAAQRVPDAVLAPSEPYPFTARQLPELSTVAPTVFIDGKDLFWWGARTPDAISRLGGVVANL